MLKIVTVVGTRPEIIKLSRVIAALDENFEHTLVHTGQNYDYELNQVFFDELGIRKPDFFLEAAGKNATETIANVLIKTDQLFDSVQPHALLILGDTNSALCAIAAKKKKIPIFHMEAGNRSFDERVPEEVNRRIIDHVSDINLVYTEHARRYLLAEGMAADRVLKTGSPMREVLAYYAKDIEKSNIQTSLGLTTQKYFVVSAHREENVDDADNLQALVETLHLLRATYALPIIFSVHPRTHKRLQDATKLALPEGVVYSKPLGFLDYIKLQKSSFCVISDSGTITEESSIVGFPAVTIRNAHERPEGMDAGTLVMTGLVPEDILAAIKAVTTQHFTNEIRIPLVSDYNNQHVSAQVVRLILSYTNFVRRVVWRQR